MRSGKAGDRVWVVSHGGGIPDAVFGSELEAVVYVNRKAELAGAGRLVCQGWQIMSRVLTSCPECGGVESVYGMCLSRRCERGLW